jgi:hypothetical protein
MNPQSLIRHMQSNYIQCIASGGQPPNYKFYFYGQKAGAAAFYLVECIVNTASAKAQLKIKAEDGTTAEAFSTLFQSVLSQFGHSWSWAFSVSVMHLPPAFLALHNISAIHYFKLQAKPSGTSFYQKLGAGEICRSPPSVMQVPSDH